MNIVRPALCSISAVTSLDCGRHSQPLQVSSGCSSEGPSFWTELSMPSLRMTKSKITPAEGNEGIPRGCWHVEDCHADRGCTSSGGTPASILRRGLMCCSNHALHTMRFECTAQVPAKPAPKYYIHPAQGTHVLLQPCPAQHEIPNYC